MIVLGLDPGTGSTSPTGVFVYDTNTLEILYSKEISAKSKDVDRRIKSITDQLRPLFESLNGFGEDYLVSIEYFVMAGKSGEMLHRLIGAFLTLIPEHIPIKHVQNTSVKLMVGGSGKAEKIQVAYGVIDYFKYNQESYRELDLILSSCQYDILDAAAIAITGYKKWLNPQEKKVKSKKQKRK